ncbi:MAG: sugar transferase [Lawsonibacter sp.]|jgi:lipopolysaccharide/colanic/teichoic acid biosynthesis glycosyltransferase|uniref:sugar transferase n=1 Tax=Lawsonibacter sp. JLR.KK007 TaxID=3114293 RepID=UPI0021709BE5|nr:sugar transferase [Lawsonibacter sp.]MCI9267501.1 sugar transferase [Lawsonibacter sp.]
MDCKEIRTEAEVSGSRGYLLAKRLQDILLSGLALVALSPLLLLIAVLIVADDPKGGPFFVQDRSGLNGRVFRMYKFRTMCVDAEERLKDVLQDNEMEGPVFKIRKDPRITRIGGVLRRTSIDELPQLVNVLKGDMSLVGPRPLPTREVAVHTAYQKQRLLVTPGLTCFWQVQPNRNDISFDNWVELDLRYIRERSWLLDWKLIFLTFGALFRRDGR